MPVGNISWGKLSPKEQAMYDKNKGRASELANPQVNEGISTPGKVPAPLKQKSGSPKNAFGSVKAYNTRSNRTVYAKKG